MRRATLLINPAARGVTRRVEPGSVVSYLERRGLDVHLRIPSSRKSLVADAHRAADRGDDLLIVVGGDGSMRDAAEGIAGSETALAAVPAGTVNIWARETGVPRGFRSALDAHLGGQIVTADLGRANGRPFLLMASAGWDAVVARSVSRRLKRVAGDSAYIVQAFIRSPRMRTKPARWEAGGLHREGPLALMVVSNTGLYGGRVRFSPGAIVDDGLLDAVALCPRSPLDVVRLSAALMRGQLAAHPRVYADRVERLFLETPNIPLQLDGDYAGVTPTEFRVDRGALRVSIPAGPVSLIFGGGEAGAVQ